MADKKRDDRLDMNAPGITRRDFVNGSVPGAGAMLSGAGFGKESAYKKAMNSYSGTMFKVPDDWHGPGGVGDYAQSNGNVAELVQNARRIRAGIHKPLPDHVIDSGDFYDVVVVGCELAAISARAEVYPTSEVAFSILHDVRPPDALTQDEYELINFYVTATLDGNLDLRVYGKNVSDKFYKSRSMEGVPGFQYGIHGRPEEYGLEVRYRM